MLIDLKQEDAALLHLKSGVHLVNEELARNPEFLGLYNLACHRCLEVRLDQLTLPDPNPEQLKEREKKIQAAIDCLKALIDGGYRNFPAIRQERDFSGLHGNPQFEALFPEQE